MYDTDCAVCGCPMKSGDGEVCNHCNVDAMVDGWDYPTDEADSEDSEVGPDHDGYYY